MPDFTFPSRSLLSNFAAFSSAVNAVHIPPSFAASIAADFTAPSNYFDVLAAPNAVVYILLLQKLLLQFCDC